MFVLGWECFFTKFNKQCHIFYFYYFYSGITQIDKKNATSIKNRIEIKNLRKNEQKACLSKFQHDFIKNSIFTKKLEKTKKKPTNKQKQNLIQFELRCNDFKGVLFYQFILTLRCFSLLIRGVIITWGESLFSSLLWLGKVIFLWFIMTGVLRIWV